MLCLWSIRKRANTCTPGCSRSTGDKACRKSKTFNAFRTSDTKAPANAHRYPTRHYTLPSVVGKPEYSLLFGGICMAHSRRISEWTFYVNTYLSFDKWGILASPTDGFQFRPIYQVSAPGSRPLNRVRSNFKFGWDTFVYIFCHIYLITNKFCTFQDNGLGMSNFLWLDKFS